MAAVLCLCRTTPGRGLPKHPWGSRTLVGLRWLRVVGAGGKGVSWEQITPLLCRGALHGAAGEDTGPGSLQVAGDAVVMPGTFPIPTAAAWFWGSSPLRPQSHPWRWIRTRGAFLSPLTLPAGRNVLAAARCLAGPVWHLSCPGHASNGAGVGTALGALAMGLCPPTWLPAMLWGCIPPRGSWRCPGGASPHMAPHGAMVVRPVAPSDAGGVRPRRVFPSDAVGLRPPMLFPVMFWGCIPPCCSQQCFAFLPFSPACRPPTCLRPGKTGAPSAPPPLAPSPAGCRNACAWRAVPGSGCLGTGKPDPWERGRGQGTFPGCSWSPVPFVSPLSWGGCAPALAPPLPGDGDLGGRGGSRLRAGPSLGML